MYDSIEFIIACGGKSTRNYPHSKGLAHKSLLPFGDIRLIDFVLRDIIVAGGRHITLVCSNQETIDIFKNALKSDSVTEEKLRQNGRGAIADVLKSTFLPADVDLKFVIQSKPLGTAHVMALAHQVSKDRHGVLIFPDDLIIPKNPDHPHIQKLVDAFLKEKKHILLTGVPKEDVSNNSIIHNGRVIEKPKNPTSFIGGYSPCIFPKVLMDFVLGQYEIFLETGVLPGGHEKEWGYYDAINDFLDSPLGEQNGYQVRMFLKDEADLLMDTGTLPLYEKCQLMALLKLSRFKDENRAYLKEILAEEE